MRAPAAPARDLHLIDLAKAFALMVIVFDHLAEQFAPGAYFFNPSASQSPSIAEEVAQVLAPAGPGPWGIVGAVLRDFAWLGDEGVGLFLVLSGFGLAWGITRAGSFDLRTFAERRFGRIYPLWLTAHAIIALPLVLLGRVSLGVAVVSALGIRFLPQTYFAIVPAWWFVGLLLQLYATVPLLWWACRRFGAARMILGAVGIGLVVRGVGWNLAGNYIDEWSRGAIFVTRLPEFAFGFGLAVLCRGEVEHLLAFVRSPRIIGVALLAFVLGNVASVSALGMIFAPLLTSLGAFVLVSSVASRMRFPAGEWIGRHSYALYLSHQFTMLVFVRHPRTVAAAVVEIVLALASGLGLALLLEWLAPRLTRGLRALGPRRAAVGVAACVACMFGGEWAVRTFDPQEVYGAGERPSLVFDPFVTYKLKPNSRTHLRWLTYDYVVESNSLGFPAPEVTLQRRPGVTTIMSLGNAFSSAEGVSTPDSWPRLLERKDPRFAVADFAITGHGPNQWAEVVHTYGPLVRPDLIVVQMWVKDFSDSLLSDDQLRGWIGFDQPSATTPRAFVQLIQTHTWLQNRVLAPLQSRLHRQPDPIGYQLGGFQYFLRSDAAHQEAGFLKTRADIEQIRYEAAKWGGRVVVVMFPASIQVCRPQELPYYPQFVNFDDATTFDRDRPQRLAARLAADLHLTYIDMRAAFHGACTYAPHNMHLTPGGHQLASDYLSHALASYAGTTHVSER